MQFKIGDKVRIPSWDELLTMGHLYRGDKTFIAFGDTTNPASWGFVKMMEGACGKVATITGIDVVSEEKDEWRLTLTPQVSTNPITNYMVKMAASKYPTNKGIYVQNRG